MLRSLLLLLEAGSLLLGGDYRTPDMHVEPSGIHYRNSCYRRSVVGERKDLTFSGNFTRRGSLDWMGFKDVALQFLAGNLTIGDPLLKSTYLTATECFCKCGTCFDNVGECPIGFLFFRIFALISASPVLKWASLTRNWGCETIQYRKNYFDFIAIATSGWPFFKLMRKLGDMLPEKTKEQNAYWGGNLCEAAYWPEDADFKHRMQMDTATLELARGATSEKWCPLQRVASYALQARLKAEEELTLTRYRAIDELLVRVEDTLLMWASRDGKPPCSEGTSQYFYHLLITGWPILDELVKLSDILVDNLTIKCERRGPDRPLYRLKPRIGEKSRQCKKAHGRRDECHGEKHSAEGHQGEDRNAVITGTMDSRRCPACETPIQSDSIREAEYVRKFYEEFELIPPKDINRFPKPQNFNWSTHAFGAVLFPGNNAEFQADFIRILAHSVRKVHGEDARFIILTGPSIDAEIKASLEEFHEVRTCTPMVVNEDAYGSNTNANANEENMRRQWWLERQQLPNALKLCLWIFLDLLSVIFLDADMIVISPMWNIFALHVPFASGVTPGVINRIVYDGKIFHSQNLNTGIMMVRPSLEIYVDMKTKMKEGMTSNLLNYVGYSNQPWLDTFWTLRNPRVDMKDIFLCETAECEQSSHRVYRHAVIPMEYNFFVDYKSVRTMTLSLAHNEEGRGNSTLLENLKFTAQNLGFGLSDVRAVHWPGELRKPWHNLSPMVRSPWDDMWWDMKEKVCATQDCFIEC